MSFRPTCSVYINGHIADHVYCKGWSAKEMMILFMRLIAFCDGCKNVEEYFKTLYGGKPSDLPEILGITERERR